MDGGTDAQIQTEATTYPKAKLASGKNPYVVFYAP